MVDLAAEIAEMSKNVKMKTRKARKSKRKCEIKSIDKILMKKLKQKIQRNPQHTRRYEKWTKFIRRNHRFHDNTKTILSRNRKKDNKCKENQHD